MAIVPESAYLHETWAGLLIALSLLLYQPYKWAAAVCLGVAACVFRELAFGYLIAMGAAALLERRWRRTSGLDREAVAASLLLFAQCISTGRVAKAATLYRPGDPFSQGWADFSGLPFVLLSARWNLALHLAPDPVVAAAIGLSLIGLLGSRDPRARRAALVIGGYVLAFTVVGRPENEYWGKLYAPLLPVEASCWLRGACRDMLRCRHTSRSSGLAHAPSVVRATREPAGSAANGWVSTHR